MWCVCVYVWYRSKNNSESILSSHLVFEAGSLLYVSLCGILQVSCLTQGSAAITDVHCHSQLLMWVPGTELGLLSVFTAEPSPEPWPFLINSLCSCLYPHDYVQFYFLFQESQWLFAMLWPPPISERFPFDVHVVFWICKCSRGFLRHGYQVVYVRAIGGSLVRFLYGLWNGSKSWSLCALPIIRKKEN